MMSFGTPRLAALDTCNCVLMVRRISRACDAMASPRLACIWFERMSFSVSQRTSLRLVALSGPMTVTSCFFCVRASARLPFCGRAVLLVNLGIGHPFFDFAVEIDGE